MRLFVMIRIFIILLILCSCSSTYSGLKRSKSLGRPEVPLYPNAQYESKRSEEHPALDDVQYWNFVTNDSPHEVIQYYKDIYAGQEKRVVFDKEELLWISFDRACPIWSLVFTVMIDGNGLANVEVRSGSQPCTGG